MAVISFAAEAQDVKEFISFLDSVVVSPSVLIPYDSLPTFDSSQFDEVKIVRKDGVILEPVGNVKKTIARNGDMRYRLVGDIVPGSISKREVEYAPMIVVYNKLLNNEVVVRIDYDSWPGQELTVACVTDYLVYGDKIILLGRDKDPSLWVELVYDMTTQRLEVFSVCGEPMLFSPDKEWVIYGDPRYPTFRKTVEEEFSMIIDD